MENTPGPWKKSKGTNGVINIEAEPYGDGRIVAHVFTTMHSEENREANADLIVRACNSHNELLAACKVGLQWVPKTKEDAIKIRAAIAKAEGR